MDADAYLKRADERRNQVPPDLDGAMEDYTKAIALDLGEFDRAIEDHLRANEFDPKFVEVWLERTNAWEKKGEHERARADRERAAELQRTTRQQLCQC